MKRPLQGRDSSDDDISGTEAMLRTREQRKKTWLVSSSPSAASKINWTKTQELLILQGIVNFQKETKLSYTSHWDANRRFRANQARATDGNIPYFTNTHDEQVFKLSKILWGTEKETNFAYEEDQIKEDVSCAVQEESLKIDDGEKDKCEEDGMDDLRLLQEALVLAASFQSLGNNQRKSLLQNLRNVGATQRKELKDDWKALLAEEMQLDIKKQSFYAKLVNAGFSA
ncbi:unnamed protein product [Arabidopsis lyrata]|nr:unnamed protein product [Arabidopsis lyrata]